MDGTGKTNSKSKRVGGNLLMRPRTWMNCSSRHSMLSYILTYSRLRKKGTFDSPGLLPGGGGGQAPVDEVTDLDEKLQQAQHVKLYPDLLQD